MRAWPLEDQVRHIIALGKIGDLMQKQIAGNQKGSGTPRSPGAVHIVNRGGRHCLVD